MKSFKMSSVLIALLVSCFSITMTAQDQEAFVEFGTNSKAVAADLFIKGEIDDKTSFIMPMAATKKAKPVPARMMKKLKLPKGVKMLKGPIVVQLDEKGENCYQVGCKKSKDCKNCLLLWKDMNKDGKIQPRKELRCVCPSKRTRCGLYAERVECKKEKKKK